LSEKNKETQLNVKKQILKRLFPGLRDASNGEIGWIIARMSQLTYEPTAQSDIFTPGEWFNQASGVETDLITTQNQGIQQTVASMKANDVPNLIKME
jgi:hypothetical protein